MTGRRSHVDRAAPRLSKGHRRLVYTITTVAWSTGSAWLLFHYALRLPGAFGDIPHPLEAWWLKLHGAAAFAALWLAGLLWGRHVVWAWSAGQRRRSGGGLAAAFGVLSLTGYLLYYVADDRLRGASSITHWMLGLALPLLLGIHVWKVRQSRRHVLPHA